MTGTPRCPALLLLVLVMVAGSGHAFSCNPRQHTAMQERFTGCRGGLLAEYHASSSSSDICQLVAGIVEGCGRVWEECHTPGDIATMRNMHIQAFIEQWEGRQPGIEECGVVREYRKMILRGSDLSSQDELKDCGDEEANQAMTEFQQCSHTIITAVYQSVGDIESNNANTNRPGSSNSGGQLAAFLCQALSNISASCPHLLAGCFAPEDLKQIRNMHLTEMKDFLLRLVENRLVGGGGGEAALDACLPTGVAHSDDDDYYDDSIDYLITDTLKGGGGGGGSSSNGLDRGGTLPMDKVVGGGQYKGLQVATDVLDEEDGGNKAVEDWLDDYDRDNYYVEDNFEESLSRVKDLLNLDSSSREELEEEEKEEEEDEEVSKDRGRKIEERLVKNPRVNSSNRPSGAYSYWTVIPAVVIARVSCRYSYR